MSDLEILQGNLTLGKPTTYESTYNPKILCSIARSEGREKLESNHSLFTGYDIWNAYELSWLNSRGKPMVSIAEFHIPCSSAALVESKSLKLYLNSFSNVSFLSLDDVKNTLEKDLSSITSSQVQVFIETDLDKCNSNTPDKNGFGGILLDDLDATINTYHVDRSILQLTDADSNIKEKVYSHLLKTNCPVTGQPDWASIFIEYKGRKICPESILKYICSYRNHQDFHEHCIENIFLDILMQCQCEELTVEGRYTRRGGIDINPFRTNCGAKPWNLKTQRQ